MMLNMKRYWIVGYEKWEIEIRIIESDKKFLFLVHLIAMEIRIGRKKTHSSDDRNFKIKSHLFSMSRLRRLSFLKIMQITFKIIVTRRRKVETWTIQ